MVEINYVVYFELYEHSEVIDRVARKSVIKAELLRYSEDFFSLLHPGVMVMIVSEEHHQREKLSSRASHVEVDPVRESVTVYLEPVRVWGREELDHLRLILDSLGWVIWDER